MDRIKKLRIPPAWTNIKISNDATSYLQVTGIDKQKKTQYIYHPLFVSLSQYNKYSRLKEFCRHLKNLDKKIDSVKRDLKDPEYIMCLMFRILYKTYIRVGNECYSNTDNPKKTYGLTTLQKKHVIITGDKILFDFVGKKHIRHKIELVDKSIAKDLAELTKDLGPNQSIFNIKSSQLNNYLNKFVVLSEKSSDFSDKTTFTCKDFRTYASNRLFIETLQKYPEPKTPEEIEKNIKDTFEFVAKELGHTKAISRSSYVMPAVVEKYRKTPKFFYKEDSVKIMVSLV